MLFVLPMERGEKSEARDHHCHDKSSAPKTSKGTIDNGGSYGMWPSRAALVPIQTPVQDATKGKTVDLKHVINGLLRS